MNSVVLIAVLVSVPLALPTRQADTVTPIAIPADRALDAYAIYSQLLRTTDDTLRPQPAYLIAAPIEPSVSVGETCSDGDPAWNPHKTITAPAQQQADFAEILADFDRHCHDRIALDQAKIVTHQPVLLLSPADQQAFVRYRTAVGRREIPDAGTAAKFHGAEVLYNFSNVYFNHRHTVALVLVGRWYGNVGCSTNWVVLGREAGGWYFLPGWSTPMAEC